MILLCKAYSSNFLPEIIRAELARYKYVFNPSFVTLKNVEYWAFRCFDETANAILCVLYSWDKSKRTVQSIILNGLFAERFNERPADPKLFAFKNKVYCTLNSGHVSSGNNSIYLMEVDEMAVIHNLKKCVIHSRNTIEKNWAFFEEDGKLKLLYSLSPVCRIYSLESQTEHEFVFQLEKQKENNLPEFSIGTQPQLKNGCLYLIAHRKYFFRGKRLYIGIPVKVDLRNLNVYPSGKKMIHSIRALLGSKFKFNRNLISCTYFSGLQFNEENNSVKIAYGINDISWNSSEINANKLWQ